MRSSKSVEYVCYFLGASYVLDSIPPLTISVNNAPQVMRLVDVRLSFLLLYSLSSYDVRSFRFIRLYQDMFLRCFLLVVKHK
jgi:hypothetical protein